MPIYRNDNNNTVIVNGIKFEPGEEVEVSYYIHYPGLTLVSDSSPKSKIIASESISISAGNTYTITPDINQNDVIEIEIICESGTIDIYYNSTSTTGVRLEAYEKFEDEVLAKNINSVVISAVSDSDVRYVISRKVVT